MHAHAHAHVHVHGAPPNTLTESHPHSPTPTPPGGWIPEMSQVIKYLTNRDISILFEDFGSLNTCAFILTTFGVQVGGCPITNSTFYF